MLNEITALAVLADPEAASQPIMELCFTIAIGIISVRLAMNVPADRIKQSLWRSSQTDSLDLGLSIIGIIALVVAWVPPLASWVLQSLTLLDASGAVSFTSHCVLAAVAGLILGVGLGANRGEPQKSHSEDQTSLL